MPAPEKGADLNRFEFRTESPDWISKELWPHVGVVVNDEDDTYYKALILKENGEYRWRYWHKESERNGPAQYGPDLPPEIANMLMAYMNEAR